ncbi:MAG: DJ-1/PfpI family protein [Candidatus Absconditabacteria bacterium]
MKKTNIFLYVLESLADWEVGYLTAELNSKRFASYPEKFSDIIKISKSLDSITTMGGMKIKPDKIYTDIEFQSGDLLILPGSNNRDDNMEIIDLAQNLLNNGVIVAGICGATIALSKVGILNKYSHTSNDKNLLKMISSNYCGDDKYKDKPSVCHNNLITASGLAPLEFTYEILQKINYMKPQVLHNWYQLYSTRDGKYYMDLIESMSN